jgi:hypothetical protein
VSGKSGGYYGCFGAVRGRCENRLLVRRTLAERIIKAAELEAEDRRIANFVEFVAEGRGSRTLAEALLASERKRDDLKADLELLRNAQNAVQSAPPQIWIEERISTLQEVRRSVRSCQRGS